MYEGIKDIYNLLDENRLKEAFIQLKALATNARKWDLPERIDMAEAAYGYMLEYAAKGVNDPTRKEFFWKSKRTAYELTDELNIALRMIDSYEDYYKTMRMWVIEPPKTYAQLSAALEAYAVDMETAPLLCPDPKKLKAKIEKIEQVHEKALDELFNRTWTTPRWTDMEAREATEMLKSNLVPINDLAVLMSATTMALLRIFDSKKMHFLLEAYSHPEAMVNQRALVGMVIATLKHSKRLNQYPDITSRIKLMGEEKAFCHDVFNIQMQLLVTRETTKIDRKMREDIIPKMIRKSQELKKNNTSSDREDMLGENPEWEEWMEKSGMNKKLKEMGEWHQEGADVFMSSFAQLKHAPFFNTMSHWFYPFNLQHPMMEPLRSKMKSEPTSPLWLVPYSPYVCNSDKYSFAFAMLEMLNISKGDLTIATDSLFTNNEISEEAAQEMKTKKLQTSDITRQYIQDLYRFFKLWIKKDKKEDIFEWELNLWSNNYLYFTVTGNPENLKYLTGYLIQKEYLNEALNLFDILERDKEDSVEMLQKLGYLCQKKKDYELAIKHYTKADLKQPDNLWTIKQLGLCYKMNRNYDKAISCLKKAESIDPDDLNIAMQIGHCQCAIGRQDRAMQYFHKVEFLSPKPNNARRAIAWCSFQLGKDEDALKYYRLLVEDGAANATDHMNAGHAYMAMRQMKEAVKHYRLAHKDEKSHSDFIEKIQEDKYDMIIRGISDEDICIMLDLLL